MTPGVRARLIVVGAVVLTAVIYVVPQGYYVGYPLMLLSTYAHEMGHGVAAELVGGDFLEFRMYPDASGVARSVGRFGRIATGLIAAGGLVGPAILAAIFFAFTVNGRRARWGLLLFGAATVASVILVVRGWFGLMFISAVGGVSLLLAMKAGELVSQAAVAFLATQLSLSVFSRGDYLFTDVAITGEGTHPSDVAHMAEALFLPYWFWGAVCGLFSLGVLAFGLWLFWRGTAGAARPDKQPVSKVA